MTHKLKQDPDKYERMFAAQYLARYSSTKTKKILLEAINDKDPEIVTFIKIFLKINQSKKK